MSHVTCSKLLYITIRGMCQDGNLRNFPPSNIKASSETNIKSRATTTLNGRERGNPLTEQKTSGLETVNQQITALREQLNKTHDNIGKHIEKRDQLNEQAKNLRQEINIYKKERDQLNKNVKTLKQNRDEVRAQMAPFIEEIKAHSQKIAELKEKISGGSRQGLQKAFDALEFKIATTTLDLKEEKRLIEQVKEIETKLSVYKKIDQIRKKISALKSELKVFQEKADGFHKELTECAKSSQDLHSKMLVKFEEMKKIREEATNLHLMFLQNREKIKPIHEEIGKLMGQRQKIFEQKRKNYELIKEENAKVKKAKENELKEKLGSQVREKLQRGEKLNWLEFQLLDTDADGSGTED